MPLILLALALAPGLVIGIYIYSRDRYEKEPIKLLLLMFLFGMLSVVPAIIMELAGAELFKFPESIFSHLFHAFVVVGFSEEFCKYLFVRYAYKRPEFNEPYDGIVYAVMVSLGFATLENVMYVYSGGLNVALMRMFTAVPAHASFAIIMGYFMGLAKFTPGREKTLSRYGLLGAVLFHGAYDFCLFVNHIVPIAAGAFISLIVAIYLSRKAMRLHTVTSPFHPNNYFDKRDYDL